MMGPEPIIKTDLMDVSLGITIKLMAPKINVNVETGVNKKSKPPGFAIVDV